MPTMSSLARAMETQKDNQKIGEMRCRGRKKGREDMWRGVKRRESIWNSERLGEKREPQEERNRVGGKRRKADCSKACFCFL